MEHSSWVPIEMSTLILVISSLTGVKGHFSTLDGNPDTNKDDPSKLAIEQNVIVVKEIVSRTF